jgi:hypothetical protein
MNDSNRWGPAEYLTVLGIGNLAHMAFSNLGASLAATMSLFRFGILFFIATWITFGGYLLIEITPWWVWLIITVAVGTLLFLVGYNKHIARKNDIERQRQQQQALEEATSFAETYLANLEFHYYDFEKKKYLDWLISSNWLPHFRDMSDVDRLKTIGAVTGKYYVCDLNSMSNEQMIAKREAAWNRTRKEQREKQLLINAAEKEARRTRRAT